MDGGTGVNRTSALLVRVRVTYLLLKVKVSQGHHQSWKKVCVLWLCVMCVTCVTCVMCVCTPEATVDPHGDVSGGPDLSWVHVVIHRLRVSQMIDSLCLETSCRVTGVHVESRLTLY